MTQADSPNPYAVSSMDGPVAFAAESERLTFIKRTYAHLSGAVLALIALEAVLFSVVPQQTMQGLVIRMTSGYGWLFVLGAFMVVSWIARSWAMSGGSRAMQYAGLALYVGANAVILLSVVLMIIYGLTRVVDIRKEL